MLPSVKPEVTVTVVALPENMGVGLAEAVAVTAGNTFTVAVVGEPSHVYAPSVYIKVYVNDTSIGALLLLVNVPRCVPAPAVVVNVLLVRFISPLPDKSVCVERVHE
jgi:hypothetical protein